MDGVAIDDAETVVVMEVRVRQSGQFCKVSGIRAYPKAVAQTASCRSFVKFMVVLF